MRLALPVLLDTALLSGGCVALDCWWIAHRKRADRDTADRRVFLVSLGDLTPNTVVSDRIGGSHSHASGPEQAVAGRVRFAATPRGVPAGPEPGLTAGIPSPVSEPYDLGHASHRTSCRSFR